MSRFKAAVLDASLFRRSYIICLFMFNMTLLLVPALIVLAVLFVWGSFLVIFNEIKKRTALHTRYGLWLILFLIVAAVAVVTHFGSSLMANAYNIILLFHLAICFFVYYGVHTEEGFNFRREFYSTCSFVVYATTVLNLLGLACLFAGIRVETFGMGFIVFESRFTGMFMNPNYLGYFAVFAIFCVHALMKKDFIEISGYKKVSSAWLISCAVVNFISLMLSDSNASILLMIGYLLIYSLYRLFGKDSRFGFSLFGKPIRFGFKTGGGALKVLGRYAVRTVAFLLVCAVVVSSMLYVRHFTQIGFKKIMDMTKKVTVLKEAEVTDEVVVTFEHENTNKDSGRITLWKQASKMYKISPIVGIGKGNIDDYGKKLFKKGVKFSKKYGVFAPVITDFHNGYIMTIICAGTLGFLLICIFGLRFFLPLTRIVFVDGRLSESSLPCVFSFLCAYLAYSMVEITLLFQTTFTVVSFWMLMGYASCFMNEFGSPRTTKTFSLFGKKLRRDLV